MSRKFWQTKKFRELSEKWEALLAESGFVDAEKHSGGKSVLKQKATNCYRQASAVAREAKQRYFELLGAHFHKEEFTDDVEAFVMEQRSCGVKIKRICDELSAMDERCHRETIRGIIRKYEHKWGIKK